MSGPFFGVIEKVESSGIELSLRCIREYHHDDGLMLGDVWIWKLEEAQADARAILKAIVGVPLHDLALRSGDSGPELVIYSDELTEPVSVRAKRIWKTEESRNFLDLEKLVGELSLRIRRDDADYIAQSRKISECAAFVEQLIDRMRKRADFEAARDSTKLSAVEREIHDLEAVLLRLRAPVEPS